MKLILAIIRPESPAAVQAALNKRGVYALTIGEAFGYGSEGGPVEIYRGRTFRRPVAKLRVEVAVSDAVLDAVLAGILGATRDGEAGRACDDRVFVMRLDECVQVHPREPTGADAGR